MSSTEPELRAQQLGSASSTGRRAAPALPSRPGPTPRVPGRHPGKRPCLHASASAASASAARCWASASFAWAPPASRQPPQPRPAARCWASASFAWAAASVACASWLRASAAATSCLFAVGPPPFAVAPPPGPPRGPWGEPARQSASPRIAIAPRRRARTLARLWTREPGRSSPASWLSHSKARPVVARPALELTEE